MVSSAFLTKIERLDPYLQDVMISLIREVEESASVNRREFNELKSIVKELAEVQKETKIELKELAEAQKKTEKKIEELAEAQKKTEKEVRTLVIGVPVLLSANANPSPAKRILTSSIRLQSGSERN